jgi:hypothetical protein
MDYCCCPCLTDDIIENNGAKIAGEGVVVGGLFVKWGK